MFSDSASAEQETEPSDADQKLIDAELRMIQMRDERNAFSKNMRIAAREQRDREYIMEKLDEIGKKKYSSPEIRYDSDMMNEGTMVATFADPHFGSSIKGWRNEVYDSDVAKWRMVQYLKEIFRIQKKENVRKIQLIVLGDLISGMIHKSIQITNREQVIDQVMMAGEAISDFIYELAMEFESVSVSWVPGNHSRIDQKKDALNGDRLDKLVMWYAQGVLKNLEQVTWGSYGDTLCEFNVEGLRCVGVHGDYDEFSDSGCARLISYLGYKPDVVFYAHKHRPALREYNGVCMVQAGSFVGSGDELTERCRISGCASQMICMMDSSGLGNVKIVKLS